jgi:hypothetical protein
VSIRRGRTIEIALTSRHSGIVTDNELQCASHTCGALIALSCLPLAMTASLLYEYHRIFSTIRFDLRHERKLMNPALAIRQCGIGRSFRA